MTLSIGLVGHSASGKGTIVNGAMVKGKVVVRGFTERAKDAHLKLESIRFSDILRKRLGKEDATTEELQKEAQDMEREGIENGDGPGALSRAMEKHINEEMSNVDIVLVDGVRWLTDRDMIRSFLKNMLIGIVADEEICRKRAKARGEKKGDNKKTLAQFKKEAAAPNEIHIDEIIESADCILYNNTTLEDFEKVVDVAWNEAVSRM